MVYTAPNYSSFLSFKKTLANDNANRLADIDIPFHTANIACTSNAVYYGSGDLCESLLNVGEVAFFDKGNFKDIFIKNVTAGSNGVIIVSATVPTTFTKEALQ